MLDRYRARVSGPLLDRIDLHVEVPRVSVSSLAGDTPATESSAAIRVRVLAARARATIRLARLGIAVNAHIPGREVRRVCRIDARGRRLLEAASDRLGLSARAYTRILRVARTIADLNGEDEITAAHDAPSSRRRAAVASTRPGWATGAPRPTSPGGGVPTVDRAERQRRARAV